MTDDNVDLGAFKDIVRRTLEEARGAARYRARMSGAAGCPRRAGWPGQAGGDGQVQDRTHVIRSYSGR